jgi:Transposase DDE domain
LKWSQVFISRSLTLLASKKWGTLVWKFFAWSRSGLPTSMILETYRLRFQIEQFHKDTKQYLGLMDAGLKNYDAIKAHVHWVYCAYLLLHDFHLPLTKIGTPERQKILMTMHSSDECRHLIPLSSRIQGSKSVKTYCRKKQEALYAA